MFQIYECLGLWGQVLLSTSDAHYIPFRMRKAKINIQGILTMFGI